MKYCYSIKQRRSVVNTVLFVDDNETTLNGYKRLFKNSDKSWRVLFANDAAEAIESIQHHFIDVIISDLEMPVINGAILLSHVKKISPLTMRIIFTGCAEEKYVMKTVKLAHQIYLKPNSYRGIIAILNRAFYLHKIKMNPAVRKILMNIGTIPSLPEIVNEIIIAAEDENYSLKELSNLIEQDIGMSMNVLRLINSPYFGMKSQIVSIDQAVTLLGLEILKTLIISVHLFESFPNLDVTEMHEIMQHSFNSANNCRKILQLENRSIEECDEGFITGFMHDIGRIIISSSLPKENELILMQHNKSEIPIARAEQNIIGVTHEEISAFVLALWGFEDHIIEAVAFHHIPSKSHCEEPLLLAAMHCADIYDYELSDNCISREEGLDIEFLEKHNLLKHEEKWLEICENNN